MIGQYKTDYFNVGAIRQLVDDLHAAGLPVKTIWKKGTKVVENPDDGVGNVTLELDGEWVLRQMKGKGTVRVDKVEPGKQEAFLRCLKANDCYTEPNWALGIGCLVAYGLLMLLGAGSSEASAMAGIMIISALLVGVLLGVLSAASTGKVPPFVFWPLLVIGGLGYLATAPGSLLAIPMITVIMKNGLYTRVMRVQARPAPAVASAE